VSFRLFPSLYRQEVVTMTKAVVVRYQTRAEAAESNQRLIEQVFAELNAEDPGGVRYAAFRLADGAGFVHVALFEGDGNPLASSKAFAAFQDGAAERQAGPPVVSEATLIGSYRMVKEKR
jgi:hypothetical protein